MALGGLSLLAGVAALVTGTTVLATVAGVLGMATGGLVVVVARRAAAAETARVGSEADAEAGRHALELAEARIRSLEAALATPPPPPPTDSLLRDAETGMPGAASFTVSLEGRVAAARRHLRPVAVVLLEIRDPNGLPAEVHLVAEQLRRTLRSADTVCRFEGTTRFGLVLEDTSEEGAVWTVERFRRALTAAATRPHLLWAGVACYPAHGFEPGELRQQATEALNAAKHWRQDRIEVAAPSPA